MVTESLLNFVDLAGSEKVSNHYISQEDLITSDINMYIYICLYLNINILVILPLKSKIESKKVNSLIKAYFF